MTILTLVITLAIIIGIPLPAHAAGEESSPLTINGLSLSQLLNSTATGGPSPLAGLLGQETGLITGVALDAEGEPLADHAVELRSLSERATATPMVATMMTDANGGFSFSGLRQGRYVVDLHVDEQVVATSGAIALAEGGMAFTQVGGIAAQPSTIDDRKGGLFWTAVGAGVGGALGLVAIATDRDDCETAESQCPAVPIFTTTIGALVGLLIGL